MCQRHKPSKVGRRIEWYGESTSIGLDVCVISSPSGLGLWYRDGGPARLSGRSLSSARDVPKARAAPLGLPSKLGVPSRRDRTRTKSPVDSHCQRAKGCPGREMSTNLCGKLSSGTTWRAGVKQSVGVKREDFLMILRCLVETGPGWLRVIIDNLGRNRHAELDPLAFYPSHPSFRRVDVWLPKGALKSMVAQQQQPPRGRFEGGRVQVVCCTCDMWYPL